MQSGDWLNGEGVGDDSGKGLDMSLSDCDAWWSFPSHLHISAGHWWRLTLAMIPAEAHSLTSALDSTHKPEPDAGPRFASHRLRGRAKQYAPT